jgi:hypothetical protein
VNEVKSIPRIPIAEINVGEVEENIFGGTVQLHIVIRVENTVFKEFHD